LGLIFLRYTGWNVRPNRGRELRDSGLIDMMTGKSGVVHNQDFNLAEIGIRPHQMSFN
jgi:hypothetical protein